MKEKQETTSKIVVHRHYAPEVSFMILVFIDGEERTDPAMYLSLSLIF